MSNGVYLYIESDLVPYDENFEAFIEGTCELKIVSGITPNAVQTFKAFLNDFYAKIAEYKTTLTSNTIDFYQKHSAAPFTLEGGSYFLELPETHRVNVLQVAIFIAAKHKIIVMAEENDTFYFFPDNRVEPNIDWYAFVPDTITVKTFPQTLQHFIEDMEPDLNQLFTKHGFEKCTSPLFYSGEGYVKEVAFGKIYATASSDTAKWGGYSFNLYFYLVHDLEVSIYNQFFDASERDLYTYQFSLKNISNGETTKIENFNHKKAILKKINHDLFGNIINNINTLSNLDSFMNDSKNSKFRGLENKAHNLIVAKLANNPDFENIALKWQFVNEYQENYKSRFTNLIQYLRDNYSKDHNTENSLETQNIQAQKNSRTELCTLSCDTLYIWDPKHYKVEPEDDVAARQCIMTLLQQQLCPPSNDSIQTFVKKIEQRFRKQYADIPELMKLYGNLFNDYMLHSEILAKIPLPKTNRLLARHEIIRLATENELVAYDGQSSVVFFPDLLSFKQRMLMVANRIKHPDGPEGTQHNFKVVNQLLQLDDDAFVFDYENEDWDRNWDRGGAQSKDYGLTLHEQGPIFLKTGHIFPKYQKGQALVDSQDTLWRASLKYLDSKLRHNPRPFESHLLPIEPLLDDLMAKYDFKKSTIPLLIDIIGYYHRTQNSTQYLASKQISDCVTLFRKMTAYISINSIEAIYQKFSFAPIAEMFSFSIHVKIIKISDPISYQDLDTFLNEAEVKVLSLMKKFESITELDAAINGDKYPEIKAGLKKEAMPFRLILARLAHNPNFEYLVREFNKVEAAEWGANHKAKETEYPKLVQFLRQRELT